MRRGHFHIHKHHHPKRELFKEEDSSSKKGRRHIRVCPNCGHNEFSIVPSHWNFLLGQKNMCKKCSFIFRRPYTELEYQKAKEFERTRR